MVEDKLEQVRDLEKRHLLCLKIKNKGILIFTFNSSESELKEANCRKVLSLKFLFFFQACFPFFFLIIYPQKYFFLNLDWKLKVWPGELLHNSDKYARATPTNITAGNYMFKVKNRNTRTRCEMCSKFTIKTPERRLRRRSGVFIVNFEHISHLVLVFLLLTLNS